jgi:hypothetical protein
MPTGTKRVTGRGAQPYLQFPWSSELHDRWSVSGRVTAFLLSADPRMIKRPTGSKNSSASAPTYSSGTSGTFRHDGRRHVFNSGVAYRLMRTRQIDFLRFIDQCTGLCGRRVLVSIRTICSDRSDRRLFSARSRTVFPSTTFPYQTPARVS